MPVGRERPERARTGSARTPKLIDLRQAARHPLARLVLTLLELPLERTLAVKALNDIYARADFGADSANFFRIALDALRTDYALAEDDWKKIPKDGPLVVVANHPFGGIEGVILGDILSRVRPDIKILGNYLLHYIEPLRDRVIAVDPFGSRGSIAGNGRAMKEAMRWVAAGGALLTFPSGEVSHLKLGRGGVTDPPWSAHIAGIARRSGAGVLPVYFRGCNSFLFQLAGLVHPRLRTALLPRELMNKSGKVVRLRVGNVIPARRLVELSSDHERIDYLRFSTYLLKYRHEAPPEPPAPAWPPRRQEAVIAPVAPDLLQREVAGLPADHRLADSREYSVYVARAAQIPAVLQEIGRLREVTFREVQEGTGRAIDLDRFDEYYEHLFLWDKRFGAVVGAYRLGLADRILREHGRRGLYTSTLFHFKPAFLCSLDNSIELGRSFIRSEYQRKPASLAMLWRGIGEFVVRNPRYRMLFGPVSISDDYQSVSKNLIIRFLREKRLDSKLSRYVSARRPYRCRRLGAVDMRAMGTSLRDIEDISLLVSALEQDGKGVPVLLRHYLKLNATLASFNVDSAFSGVVDGLILVDLVEAEPKLLKRFMGDEGYARFIRRHERSAQPRILAAAR